MIERKTKDEIRQLAIDEDKLIRDVRREEMIRIEEAARSEEDFDSVIKDWDKLDANRERRERYHEQSLTSEMFDWDIFYRQVRNDKDIINGLSTCICQMHVLADDHDLSRLINKATNKQKSVFFSRVIVGCPTRKISDCYGMTDRNVRKLLDLMLDNIRTEFHAVLENRRKNNLPMLAEHERFLDTYKPKVRKNKKEKNNPPI
jgi:DNA-directed RNA polymerase specialized sigma24 family protein